MSCLSQIVINNHLRWLANCKFQIHKIIQSTILNYKLFLNKSKLFASGSNDTPTPHYFGNFTE